MCVCLTFSLLLLLLLFVSHKCRFRNKSIKSHHNDTHHKPTTATTKTAPAAPSCCTDIPMAQKNTYIFQLISRMATFFYYWSLKECGTNIRKLLIPRTKSLSAITYNVLFYRPVVEQRKYMQNHWYVKSYCARRKRVETKKKQPATVLFLFGI